MNDETIIHIDFHKAARPKTKDAYAATLQQMSASERHAEKIRLFTEWEYQRHAHDSKQYLSSEEWRQRWPKANILELERLERERTAFAADAQRRTEAFEHGLQAEREAFTRQQEQQRLLEKQQCKVEAERPQPKRALLRLLLLLLQ